MAILEIISSIAAIGGLVFIAVELQRSRKAERRQFLFDSIKYWDVDLEQARRIVSKYPNEGFDYWIENYMDNLELSESIFKVYNFLEMLAEAAKDGTIEKKVAIQHWGILAVGYWDLYEDNTLKMREGGWGRDFLESLEWLAKETLKVRPETKNAVIEQQNTLNAAIKRLEKKN